MSDLKNIHSAPHTNYFLKSGMKFNKLSLMHSKLVSEFNMKLVVYPLIFSTYIRTHQMISRSSSYDLNSEKVSKYILFQK